MTKTRGHWLGRREARRAGPDEEPRDPVEVDPGPVTPIEPVRLAECLRACERYGADPAAEPPGAEPAYGELTAKLRRLPAAAGAGGAADLTERQEGAGAAADSEPEQVTPAQELSAEELSAELLDALLDVGGTALACGPAQWRLARVISAAILTRRPDSRAGWRLRGRVLETQGDTAGAIDAYERYLARTDRDSFGVAAKVGALTAALPPERELIRLLERLDPGPEVTPDLPRTGHPVHDMEAAAERWIDRQLAAGTSAVTYDPVLLSEVVGLYAEQRRNRLRPPLADPTLGGVDWLSLGGFRDLISGRSICLVANSGTVEGGSLGERIDSYDLVVRFNAYRIDPAVTGERTDIHVTVHRNAHNWDQPVGTRLVFGTTAADYRHAVRTRLVPGAQRRVGDESLYRPVTDSGRTKADSGPTRSTGSTGSTGPGAAAAPAAGFTMMRLVDFLDVSPRFDLIGFDFFASGAYRLPEAMRLPLPSASEHATEKAWVMERAQHVNGPVISLR